MTEKQARAKIEDILKAHTVDPEIAAQISQKIFVEVVAPSVDDNNDEWVNVSKRPELLDS